jgi:hypothetical protein
MTDRLQRVVDRLDIGPDDRVLDVGDGEVFAFFDPPAAR